MATKSIHSLLLNRHHNNHPSDSTSTPTTAAATTILFLKPTTSTTTSLSSSSTISTNTTTFSISPTTSTSSSTSQAISFELLEQHLSTQNYRQADEETRRLLIVLAGEAAQKRGYVFFSELQFISEADLKAIDDLWRHYSDNKFGYSVQKKIWQKVNKDFTKFFLKVGWMKKLDTEVEQYNYRAFPNEFMWELNKDTPEGHLPLTNALRGTRLLNSILSHQAIRGVEEEEEEDKVGEEKNSNEKSDGVVKGLRDGSKLLGKTVFKPNYSF